MSITLIIKYICINGIILRLLIWNLKTLIALTSTNIQWDSPFMKQAGTMNRPFSICSIGLRLKTTTGQLSAVLKRLFQ